MKLIPIICWPIPGRSRFAIAIEKFQILWCFVSGVLEGHKVHVPFKRRLVNESGIFLNPGWLGHKVGHSVEKKHLQEPNQVVHERNVLSAPIDAEEIGHQLAISNGRFPVET